MPVDARTEAIIHLVEAFAEQGKSFAVFMKTRPDEAEQAIQSYIDTPDDDEDDLDDDDFDVELGDDLDDTDTYDPADDVDFGDEEAA